MRDRQAGSRHRQAGRQAGSLDSLDRGRGSTWLSEQRKPRCDGGATSGMKRDTQHSAAPMPRPQIRRPSSSAEKERALAQRAAPTAQVVAVYAKLPLRPTPSASGPPEAWGVRRAGEGGVRRACCVLRAA